MSYAPTAKELERWSKGPALDSLFGKIFPLARVHPNWQNIEQGNDRWMEGNWEWDDEELREYIMSSQFGLLSSMCFPFGEDEILLWICRLITVLFCLDEDLDRHRNLHLLPILKGLCEGTLKPSDNYAEQAVNKCWREIENLSTPTNFRQFVQITKNYFDSHGRVPYENFEQYAAARLTNVGAYFMCGCIRIVLKTTISDEILAHPLIKRCEDIAGFHLAFTNDLISYTKEYLTDTAENNILTLLQRNDGLSLSDAEAKIRWEIKKTEENYVEAARAVFEDPVLGKDEDVRKLILNIPYGMEGNVSGCRFYLIFFDHLPLLKYFLWAWWSLVTKRYNVDPVNHPLPHVQINIDPAMPFHPCAVPFRKE